MQKQDSSWSFRASHLNCWLPLDEMTTNNDRSYFEKNPQYHMHRYPDLPSYEDQIQAQRSKRFDKHPNLNFVGALTWPVSNGVWID